MTNTQKIFVECVRCGILGERVCAVPEDVDFRELYRLAAAHSMSVAVSSALSDVMSRLPEAFIMHLSAAVNKHVVREVRSKHDISTVLTALESRGLKFMPLKGYLIKPLYPSADMRYASDCDILIDVHELHAVRALMDELGLVCEKHDEHHDIYYYPASKTVFEMHKSIFVGPLDKYLGTGFERARLKDGHTSFYELSPEDFYISILAHSAYHFAHEGGVGIRYVADVFLYTRSYELDRDYLDRELDACGLLDFTRSFEKLAAHFFLCEEADEFTKSLAEHVISSSILANGEKQHASDIAANLDGKTESAARKKTLWRKFFPTKEGMLFAYPVLKKAPFLYPLFYPVRWVHILFSRPSSVKKLAQITSVDSNDVASMKAIRDGLGLDSGKI